MRNLLNTKAYFAKAKVFVQPKETFEDYQEKKKTPTAQDVWFSLASAVSAQQILISTRCTLSMTVHIPNRRTLTLTGVSKTYKSTVWKNLKPYTTTPLRNLLLPVLIKKAYNLYVDCTSQDTLRGIQNQKGMDIS